MVIATVGQFFCAGSGMTSASRMMFAFSRDRAVPGHRLWSQGQPEPRARQRHAAMAALVPDRGAAGAKGNAANMPFAFYAIVSITVIGLYIAYAIPIYLRWRMGDAFVAGPWTLGNRYRWMCPVAVDRGDRHLRLHVGAVQLPRASPAGTGSRSTTASSTTRRCSSGR